MTAPDSRDSVERVVDDIHRRLDESDAPVGRARIRSWADRLQALARGPQQAGGEDGVRRFRQLTKSDGAGLLLHGGFVESATDGPWVLYEEYAELEKMYQQQGLNAFALLKRAEAAEAALRVAGRDAEHARLWRNRWVSDRTAYWQPTAGNYESARIRAEAEAADYEQTFDAARERLRSAALNGGQDDA